MKYTRKLLFIPFAAILTISASPIGGSSRGFVTDTVIGPFDDSKDFTLRVKSLQNTIIKGMLQTYNKTNGAFYGEDRFAVTNTFDYEITFFARGRVGVDGLRYVLSLGSLSYTFEIDPIISVEVNANAHKNDLVTFNNCCIGLINGKQVTSETYNFKDTLDYVTIDDTNALEMDEINVSYDLANYFVHGNCYLEVFDYIGAYTNFLSKDGYRVVFPLTVRSLFNSISFTPNTNMYVNNNTQEMSDYKIPGYLKTNKIYVPIGKEKEFESNQMNIVIEDCGFSKCKLVIPLTFFSMHKLFGACYESEYCIDGGVKE